MDDIKNAKAIELTGFPEKSFQESMQAWQRKMEKCIRHEKDYHEGKSLSVKFGLEKIACDTSPGTFCLVSFSYFKL